MNKRGCYLLERGRGLERGRDLERLPKGAETSLYLFPVGVGNNEMSLLSSRLQVSAAFATTLAPLLFLCRHSHTHPFLLSRPPSFTSLTPLTLSRPHSLFSCLFSPFSSFTFSPPFLHS